MAAIRQKLDKAFMEGKISNKDRFEFLDLIESGKLSKVELAKELMFLCLIEAMPAYPPPCSIIRIYEEAVRMSQPFIFYVPS